MCDYSLRHVASRPARVGDKLVSTTFVNSSTRGFAAVGEPNVAVCLLPGTELAFEKNLDPGCAVAFATMAYRPSCVCQIRGGGWKRSKSGIELS
jgi:hypothetical protein